MSTREQPTPGTPVTEAAAMPRAGGRVRLSYGVVLAWAFTLFNSIRLVTYLPTIWAIHQSGSSDQHSLWTWFTWAGANLTMALWLQEQQRDGGMDRAVLVNLGNALLCLLTCGVILWYR